MPEKPLSPDDSLAQFAEDLRQLRHHADDISYRSLAERVDVSPSALSQAASGRKLPTWNVTRAFVKGCGGDEKVWYEQWSQVRRELNARRTSTTNGQISASAPGGKAPESDLHDTADIPQRSELVPMGGPRSPHPATFRVPLLVAGIVIILLTGAIAINGLYGREGTDPAASDSPPTITAYISSQYQGEAGLYQTPLPSVAAINAAPLVVRPTEELKIVCQMSNGTLMSAPRVDANGVERVKENDIWYRVIPSDYYIPAVYTNWPDGVEGELPPGQPFGTRIPECTEPY